MFAGIDGRHRCAIGPSDDGDAERHVLARLDSDGAPMGRPDAGATAEMHHHQGHDQSLRRQQHHGRLPAMQRRAARGLPSKAMWTRLWFWSGIGTTMQMNVSEAKAKLSELIAAVERDEEVIIARGGIRW